MNPRQEAFDRLRGAYEVRVLEPSPPAVAEPPYFADDPVARGDVPLSARLVSPVGTGDLRWSDLAASDPDLARWCEERWLAGSRRLGAAPEGLAETRRVLHRVAEQELAPARKRVNGKIGLRYTRGGFGTPFFGDDEQVRVQGTDLVRAAAGAESREAIAAAQPAAAAYVGEWFGFAASVLEELRASAEPATTPSRVQLWPEHFDMALDLGDEAAGQRANCGCSPGDDEHPEPYCYVGPWVHQDGPLWNATAFPGAELSLADLLEADDQRAAALAFFRGRLEALKR